MREADPGTAQPKAMAPPAEPAGSAVRAMRLWRALALALAVLIAGLVFGAYSQPELLLNYSGLRYCG